MEKQKVIVYVDGFNLTYTPKLTSTGGLHRGVC